MIWNTYYYLFSISYVSILFGLFTIVRKVCVFLTVFILSNKTKENSLCTLTLKRYFNFIWHFLSNLTLNGSIVKSLTSGCWLRKHGVTPEVEMQTNMVSRYIQCRTDLFFLLGEAFFPPQSFIYLFCLTLNIDPT